MNTQVSQLDQLLDRGAVWPARQQAGSETRRADHIATGYHQLDQQLTGQGFQPGNLVEVLYDQPGSGELRLLLPLLARRSQRPGWIIWIDPPHIPYAPALAAAGINIDRVLMVHSKQDGDRLWSMEQALKSGSCCAVLGWLPEGREKAVRRLQLAAAESGTTGFLFRPLSSRHHSSGAPYRISLQPRPEGVDVKVLKRRNGWTMPARHLSLGEEHILPGQHLPHRPPASTPKLSLVD